MDFLKPCPFCGSSKVANTALWSGIIRCYNCGATTKNYPTEDEAVENWNSRTPEIFEREQALRNFAVKIVNGFLDRASIIKEAERLVNKYKLED